MKTTLTAFLALLLCTAAHGVPFDAGLPPATRAGEFNLGKDALALEGYDPVSYFEGAPLPGKGSITTTYRGVAYRFANETNREAFLQEPARFEPQYGGWCAWAMYDGGGRAEVDPESYTIVDGRLYVFYDAVFADTLRKWMRRAKSEGEDTLIATADRNWRSQFEP